MLTKLSVLIRPALTEPLSHVDADWSFTGPRSAEPGSIKQSCSFGAVPRQSQKFSVQEVKASSVRCPFCQLLPSGLVRSHLSDPPPAPLTVSAPSLPPGYPDHMVFSEFRRRFDVLTPHLTKKHGRHYIVTDEKRVSTEALKPPHPFCFVKVR